MPIARKLSEQEAVTAALCDAIVPLIGAAADRAAELRMQAKFCVEHGSETAAKQFEDEADRWGRLADAGAYALGRANGGKVQFAIPIQLSRVPVLEADPAVDSNASNAT